MHVKPDTARYTKACSVIILCRSVSYSEEKALPASTSVHSSVQASQPRSPAGVHAAQKLWILRLLQQLLHLPLHPACIPLACSDR